MLFDAIERVWTVVNANFNTDVATLASTKAVTTFTATILKRQTAEMMVSRAANKPCIGIYGVNVQTNMADGGLGGKRDSLCTVGADLVIVGSDAAEVQKQLELGAEVLVKEMCDRVVNGASLTFGGGVERLSVNVQLSDGYTDGQAPSYIGAAHVTVPVWDRDQTT